MKMPTKCFFGFTWVGWLNILILQLIFIRLSYGKEWKILTGIVPFTGWVSDYKYIFNKNR